MQRKVKLKKLPLIVAILVLIPVLTVIIFSKESMKKTNDLVTTDTISDTVPVINETRKMINPYTDSSVTISKSYYDYKGEAKEQEKSITVYENTYIQNTGIDYISTNTFDIVSVLDGTVVTVKEDELLGKIIEVKHDNGLITSYQSLSEITVQKNDKIKQGQVIGKSGTNKLDKEIGNHLHFEIYENGSSVNPINYLNKEVDN